MEKWEDLISVLKHHRVKMFAGGGPDKVKRQNQRGKNTARQRLEMLLDTDSFTEINSFVTHRCNHFNMNNNSVLGDGVITGFGNINGRYVYVFAQDFTVMGGTLGEMHAKKICNILDAAAREGCPVIGINDSGGARIQEGIDSLNGYGEIFYRNTRYSGLFPQISVILGPCAGGAVYSPAITDLIFMTKQNSQMYVTGPQVIKTVTGENYSADQLGGAEVHNTISGVAHFMSENEEGCLSQVRNVLGYLPNSFRHNAPKQQECDAPHVDLTNVVPAEPNKAYNIVDVINGVMDQDSFLEVQSMFARNACIGFARLKGQPVGIVANQPLVLAGCLDINASDKIARFVRLCDSYNLPIVTFVDVPGYLPGVDQEYGGIIRHGAKILYAYSESDVPKLTVVLRKAYGGAYIALGSKSVGANVVLAWPTAEIAVMGPMGAANILYKKEIAASKDSKAILDEMVEKYKNDFAHPYLAAGRGLVDEVIEPKETRAFLITSLAVLQGKKSHDKYRHGNIPL